MAFLVIVLVLALELNGQDRDYAMIYVYRPKEMSLNTKYPVIFNSKLIHSMPRHSKFTYKIYSQGLLQMEFIGNVKIDLVVEHGKNYYFLSPASGRTHLVDEATALEIFNNDKLFPNGHVQMAENVNDPIIPLDFQKIKTITPTIASRSENLSTTTIASDVDINIPKVEKEYPYRFALIIGNEDYKSHQREMGNEINVDFARNDALTFQKYCTNVLGIPEKNVTLLLDATSASIWQAVDKISKLIKVNNGKAEVFFYYAGHGLPHEATKEPYLIPVDVSGGNLTYAIKLNEVYSKLTESPSQKVIVFLDACFSGGARNQTLLAARGVKVKPKHDALSGNIVVFAASTDEQSSLPYKEKQHGLFTYYLLKKLQESKGNVTLSELSDYIQENVNLNSILVNNKEQSPQILFSINIEGKWSSWTLH